MFESPVFGFEIKCLQRFVIRIYYIERIIIYFGYFVG